MFTEQKNEPKTERIRFITASPRHFASQMFVINAQQKKIINDPNAAHDDVQANNGKKLVCDGHGDVHEAHNGGDVKKEYSYEVNFMSKL